VKNHLRTFYASPVGLLQIDITESRLLTLTFLPEGDSTVVLKNKTDSSEDATNETVRQLIHELNAYFSGELKQFSIEIDWDIFSGFQKEVLTLTASIPYGVVWTYGELARKLGKPNAARAVGNALGSNPLPILIPCHRVIGSDKRLHGYAGGVDAKAFLLRLEGHQIAGDRVLQTAC